MAEPERDDGGVNASNHKKTIQPYATWVVLRRYRRRTEHCSTTAAGGYARSLVTTALDFLRWLEKQGQDLGTAGQADLDQWLNEGSTVRRRLHDFIAWTNQCGLTRDLEIAWLPEGEPVNYLDDTHHLELLERCINDGELPTDVRCAGAILLLYGLHVSRIVELTSDDFEHRNGNSYIRLAKQPVIIPPALAALITAQAAAPSRPAGVDTPAWLFPGRRAGRPCASKTLTQRLRDHGIHARAARNTAVLALAEDLPAAVLSTVLGIHINTAVDWTRHASRDWTAYVAARARDLQS